MKFYPRLFRKLFMEPLMVLPDVYAAFERGLLSAIESANAEPVGNLEPRAALSEYRRDVRRAMVEKAGSVAVIHIDGVIDKRVSDFDLSCYGGVDLADVDAAITQVAGMNDVSKVIFDIHSPGGSAAGVAETAQRIRLLGEYRTRGGSSKETHARVDVLCASAAYWLASQCDVISAAPSATVGSVGVYCAILDQSAWLEKEGLKVQMLKAGKYKAMGAPWNPLSEEERGMLQDHVNELWEEFKSACSASRPIQESTMQGQCFQGEAARKVKLVDRVSPHTLEEYVASLM